jgi:hypothetical protein
MMIIGVDYHPSFQTIAFFVEEAGECGEQELSTAMMKQSDFILSCSREESVCV